MKDYLANKQETVKYVVERGLCISCGICKVACPDEAIQMNYNNEHGMIFPEVNEKVCRRCGICLNVCYGFKVNPHSFSIHSQDKTASIIGDCKGYYFGFANDSELRFNASSGGIITALLIHAMEENIIDGAIVTKMVSGSMPKAKSFIAYSKKDVLSAIGTKYCPVSLSDGLEKIEKNRRYAIVGLPCHIYGMRQLAKFNSTIKNSVKLYLGILCGGMPSYLGTEYLLKTYKMEKCFINKLEYRGGGWPGRLFINGENNCEQKTISIPYPEYWCDTFGYFEPQRCTVCHDGFNEFSDISCGDAWLPSIIKNDSIGTSLIITRTNIGEQLTLNAYEKKQINIIPIKIDEVIHSQRGLVQTKNTDLKARVNLSKFFNRNVPILNLENVVNTNLCNYMLGIEFYIFNSVASKRNLWAVLNTYFSLRRTISSAIRRRRR